MGSSSRAAAGAGLRVGQVTGGGAQETPRGSLPHLEPQASRPPHRTALRFSLVRWASWSSSPTLMSGCGAVPEAEGAPGPRSSRSTSLCSQLSRALLPLTSLAQHWSQYAWGQREEGPPPTSKPSTWLCLSPALEGCLEAEERSTQWKGSRNHSHGAGTLGL